MRICALLCVIASAGLLIAGCGAGITAPAIQALHENAADKTVPYAMPQATSAQTELALAGQNDAAVPDAKLPAAENSRLKRQIVYTASATVVVENFSEIPMRIAALVRDRGGYIANSNMQLESGAMRQGTWTIRLVGDQFDGFVEALRGLGVVTNAASNSQDVTQEYYDLEARIRNKQQQEARLLKHLDGSTRNLEEIFRVEQEVSRVREEVERMQGRMRVLQDITALSTVTLTIREIERLPPTEPVLAAAMPTFGERLSHAFSGSLHAMLNLGQESTIVLAVIGPWFVLGTALALPVHGLIRSRRRRQFAAHSAMKS